MRPKGGGLRPKGSRQRLKGREAACAPKERETDNTPRNGRRVVPHRILIAEDEPGLLDVLVQLFEHAGFETVGAPDGLAGLQAFERGCFDLVILDVMMPKIDGFALCEAIRAKSAVPIMVLTALSAEDDQLRAFRLLADDYVTKPFSLPVLLERAQALLRRAPSGKPYAQERAAAPLCVGDLQMDADAREARRAGAALALTRSEFDILLRMAARPGRVFGHAEIAAMAAGDECRWAGAEGSAKLHVMNIRRKAGYDVIETVRGVGYRVPKDL